VGLWAISLALGPLLDVLGVPLQIHNQTEPAMQDLVCFLGAGIYEEALFRLLLLSLLGFLFRLGDLPPRGADVLAILVSALIFAAAHHIGPAGEPFGGYVFLFRSIAGIYFALLYQYRGFGIAVGAHAGYDVLVGVLLQTSQSS
jgi:membrane protease YdiL (CAAX protease family)